MTVVLTEIENLSEDELRSMLKIRKHDLNVALTVGSLHLENTACMWLNRIEAELKRRSVEEPCPHCNGTELIELRNELGDVWTHKKCPYCHQSINMGGDYGSRSEY